jgi:hypothetical protein
MREGPGVRDLRLAGRLTPGAIFPPAGAETAAILQGLAIQYPNNNAGLSITITPLRDFLTAESPPTLLMLAWAAGLVLLIACANAANLMLTRTRARKPELAIRVSLGAGRHRLLRQLLAESRLLALVGGAVGLLLGAWGTFALRLLPWQGASGLGAVEIDSHVLLFTVGVSAFSALMVGVFPALRLSESGWLADLGGEGRSPTVNASGQRTRSALLIGEIALTTALLASCGAAGAQFDCPAERESGLRSSQSADVPRPSAGRQILRSAPGAAAVGACAIRLREHCYSRAIGLSGLHSFRRRVAAPRDWHSRGIGRGRIVGRRKDVGARPVHRSHRPCQRMGRRACARSPACALDLGNR